MFGRNDPLNVDTWHEPKFDISRLSIASAGSCFAQHIGKALKNNGFKYLDAEPAPDYLPVEQHQNFGYGIYSARYGNVYTVRQLLQLAEQAFGEFTPTERIWQYKNGVVDPFRPTLQPTPFDSEQELLSCRRDHLQAVAELFSSCGLLIFTMGLTESYVSKEDGSVYPVCPGVNGGEFDPNKYVFHNFGYNEIIKDFMKLKTLIAKHNPKIRFLLTVSPVPLVATATDQNVGVATTYSKSVLRAAAGALTNGRPRIDYFPSYEIISMPAMKGQFYEADNRSVRGEGVAHVMAQVMKSFKPNNGVTAPPTPASKVTPQDQEEKMSADALICDEELLDTFGN